MKLVDHASKSLIFSDDSISVIDCLNNAISKNVDIDCADFSGHNFLHCSFTLKTTGSLFKDSIFYDFKSWNGDVSASIFNGAVITKSEFRFSDLSYVIFEKSTLQNCDFSRSNLNSSCFFDVTVLNTDFAGCSFCDGADIVRSVFIDCDFTDCDFTKIEIKDSVFIDCKGLNDSHIKY